MKGIQGRGKTCRYLLRRDRRETPRSKPKVNTSPVTRSGFSLIIWRSSATLTWPLGARMSIISSSSSSEKLSLSSLVSGIVLDSDIDHTIKYVFVLTQVNGPWSGWRLTIFRRACRVNESVHADCGLRIGEKKRRSTLPELRLKCHVFSSEQFWGAVGDCLSHFGEACVSA
jgi:hypothetical protein